MTRGAEMTGSGRGMRLRVAAWTAAAALLLLPLIAMRFTDEVDWSLSDFLLFGAMLLTSGLLFEGGLRATRNLAYRAAVAIALTAAFLLIWVNLAVGIIGSESNPANLMFLGVLGVGIAGAAMARFRPLGMSRALGAAALTHALAAAIALATGAGARGAGWPSDIIFSTGFFIALWLLSAWLFAKAARDQRMAAAA